MHKQLVIIIILTGILSCDDVHKSKSTPQQSINFTAPTTTFLADLPDSLQPRVVDLQKMPPPQVVPVPKVAGGSYQYVNPSGVVTTIPLKPPVQKSLPIVLDEQGRPVLDATGKPMLMGDRGISTVTNYNSDNGLTLDGVICGTTDRFGNLWFGTPGAGINKFDGTDFLNITIAQGLAHSSITSVLEDKSGNLWFSSDGGVSCFNGWGFINFTTEQGLAYNLVKSIYQDKMGYIWFGTSGGGASRYNPDPRIKEIKKGSPTTQPNRG